MRSILLYGCEMYGRPTKGCWRSLAMTASAPFYARGAEIACNRWLRLCLTSIPARLVQRRFRCFGYIARHPDSELFKDILLPTPSRTCRRRTGGQLKTWAITINADLEPLSGPRVFGHARWRKDWVKVQVSTTAFLFVQNRHTKI